MRILTSHQYEFHYKMAQVAAEYLKPAGFEVDLQVVDWATLTQRRNDPAVWDIYYHPQPLPARARPDRPALGRVPPAGGRHARRQGRRGCLQRREHRTRTSGPSSGPRCRSVMYAEMPIIKVGDFNALSAKSPKLKGVIRRRGRFSGTSRSRSEGHPGARPFSLIVILGLDPRVQGGKSRSRRPRTPGQSRQ